MQVSKDNFELLLQYLSMLKGSSLQATIDSAHHILSQSHPIPQITADAEAVYLRYKQDGDVQIEGNQRAKLLDLVVQVSHSRAKLVLKAIE